MLEYIKDKWKYSMVRDHCYNIKWFFKNVWRYRSQLYFGLRPWDSMCGMEMLKENLKDVLSDMQDENSGHREIDETRIPKERDIARVIELIENQESDNYAERCGFDNNFSFEFKDAPGIPFIGKRMLTTESEEQEKNNDKAIEDGTKLEEKEHKELMKLLSNYRSWWT